LFYSVIETAAVFVGDVVRVCLFGNLGRHIVNISLANNIVVRFRVFKCFRLVGVQILANFFCSRVSF
jgi:hypothetical protein